MSLRYLLDEHVPRALQSDLLRREPTLTVWRVGDPGASALGTLDPDILIWCEQYEFILITNNRRSMPRHLADHLAAGRHVPGIFVLDLEMGVTETSEELILIALATVEDEHRDLIQYLPLT